jgi:tRNA-dihydrouridine synthase B
MYELYGEELGARVARKHVGWYARSLPGGDALRRAANGSANAASQRSAVRDFFDRLLAPARAPAILERAA